MIALVKYFLLFPFCLCIVEWDFNRFFPDNRWDLWIDYYELDPVFGHIHTDEGLKTTPRSTPIPAPTPTARKKATTAPLPMPTAQPKPMESKNATRAPLSKSTSISTAKSTADQKVITTSTSATILLTDPQADTKTSIKENDEIESKILNN